MNAAAKLAAYGLVLAGMIGGGAGIGTAIGPIDTGDDGGEHGAGHSGSAPEATPAPGELPAGGLLVSQDGYTFEPASRTLDAERTNPFTFTITGPDGEPFEHYQRLHDRELHLIVVSSDLAEFHHVHPTRDEEGTWSIDLPALQPGAHRAYADFQPREGDQLTLGIDLTVPGQLGPPAALVESRTVEVDGYEVTLDGHPEPASESDVTITVRRDGEVLTTEPYLGAAGHLVAIRDGDLAYLHVHPLDDEPNGPVRFAIEVPSAGTYGLYFDFALDGSVHTAAFTSVIDADLNAADVSDTNPSTPDGH
ncbi:MAG: hypothetical protein ACSLFP_02465 [Acidimicrobiales bacterium]